ncbi:MAG: hypothetical protein NZT61_07420, partial [Deltaproteobacteria bacterium]|nr:hypothetical protein [Deltaproteobacteria bacterium]
MSVTYIQTNQLGNQVQERFPVLEVLLKENLEQVLELVNKEQVFITQFWKTGFGNQATVKIQATVVGAEDQGEVLEYKVTDALGHTIKGMLPTENTYNRELINSLKRLVRGDQVIVRWNGFKGKIIETVTNNDCEHLLQEFVTLKSLTIEDIFPNLNVCVIDDIRGLTVVDRAFTNSDRPLILAFDTETREEFVGNTRREKLVTAQLAFYLEDQNQFIVLVLRPDITNLVLRRLSNKNFIVTGHNLPFDIGALKGLSPKRIIDTQREVEVFPFRSTLSMVVALLSNGYPLAKALRSGFQAGELTDDLLQYAALDALAQHYATQKYLCLKSDVEKLCCTLGTQYLYDSLSMRNLAATASALTSINQALECFCDRPVPPEVVLHLSQFGFHDIQTVKDLLNKMAELASLLLKNNTRTTYSAGVLSIHTFPILAYDKSKLDKICDIVPENYLDAHEDMIVSVYDTSYFVRNPVLEKLKECLNHYAPSPNGQVNSAMDYLEVEQSFRVLAELLLLTLCKTVIPLDDGSSQTEYTAADLLIMWQIAKRRIEEILLDTKTVLPDIPEFEEVIKPVIVWDPELQSFFWCSNVIQEAAKRGALWLLPACKCHVGFSRTIYPGGLQLLTPPKLWGSCDTADNSSLANSISINTDYGVHEIVKPYLEDPANTEFRDSFLTCLDGLQKAGFLYASVNSRRERMKLLCMLAINYWLNGSDVVLAVATAAERKEIMRTLRRISNYISRNYAVNSGKEGTTGNVEWFTLMDQRTLEIRTAKGLLRVFEQQQDHARIIVVTGSTLQNSVGPTNSEDFDISDAGQDPVVEIDTQLQDVTTAIQRPNNRNL